MLLITALLALPQLNPLPAPEVEAFDNPRITPEVRVVREVAPAVVFIETNFKRPVRNFWGTWIEEGRGEGSGVVIYDDGYIVTNNHVIQGADSITVHFDPSYDERVYKADLISAVVHEDLALLRIQRDEPFPTVRMGTSSDLMIGERVLAIGNPYGQTNTVSAGIISGLHRDVQADQLKLSNLIQTDAAINPGNSGGPLVNINGELIGINSAMRMAENIGFAIPVNEVKRVLEDHLLNVNSARAWLGLEVDLASLAVERVVAGSPADKGGLREGDHILAMDGRLATSADQYKLGRLGASPGRELEVEFERQGRRQTVTLVPWSQGNGILYTRLGMTVEGQVINPPRPMRVVSVGNLRPNGPAAMLGLKSGDIIDGVRPGRRRTELVGSPEDFAMVVQRFPPGDPIEINVWRDENQNKNLERSDDYSELFRGELKLE